jgi:tetratricopeptide (TPR) repeat protein
MAEMTDDKTAALYDKTIAQGEQLLNRLDFKGAISKFNKAIKLNPTDPRGYFNKAEASVGIPKLTVQDIGQLYEKAVELDEQKPLHFVRYGGFCLDNGLFRKAEICYREAARIDPENAYLYYSEFAIEFFYNTKRLLENLEEDSQNKVSTIAIYYLLRTLNMSKKRAEKLLADLDPVHPPFEVFEELEKKEFNDIE